jgi:hypothetical protein
MPESVHLLNGDSCSSYLGNTYRSTQQPTLPEKLECWNHIGGWFPRQRVSMDTFPAQQICHFHNKLFDCVSYSRYAERLLYRKWQTDTDRVTHVEAGLNTSTVTLRIVGSDEKGSLKSGTVKYGHKSYGTRTRKWLCWREPVAIANDRPVLSSERAPQINKPATVRQ